MFYLPKVINQQVFLLIYQKIDDHIGQDVQYEHRHNNFELQSFF